MKSNFVLYISSPELQCVLFCLHRHFEIIIIIIINILTAIGLAPGGSSPVHIYIEHYIEYFYFLNYNNICKGMCKIEDLRSYCVLDNLRHFRSRHVMATPADILAIHVHKPNTEGNQISCIYVSIGQGYGSDSYVHKPRLDLGLVCL